MTRVVLLALAGCAAFAQAVPDLEFEAAWVKLATSYPKDGKFTVGSRNEPGRYIADYAHMRDLIAEAYSVQSSSKIIGPDWITSDSALYSINATTGLRTTKEVRMMLQHLLQSRFQLKLHTTERATPIFALVAVAKGIKLTPVKFDGDDPSKGTMHPIASGMEFKHTSMKTLAGFLNNWANLGRPVIDATGVLDLFDFNLTYAMRGSEPILVPPPDSDKPTIIEAVQALGLKLETRQGTATDYVIDHVEREPVEN